MLASHRKLLPPVFARLWKYNVSRDEKLKSQRDRSREHEDNDWKIKLAGVN